MQISSIEPEQNSINVIAKVVSVKQICDRKYPEERVALSEVRLADASGIVTAVLKNSQIDAARVNSTVVIRNARSEVLEARIRLIVGRYGQIEANSDASKNLSQVNQSNDVSAIEYELAE